MEGNVQHTPAYTHTQSVLPYRIPRAATPRGIIMLYHIISYYKEAAVDK